MLAPTDSQQPVGAIGSGSAWYQLIESATDSRQPVHVHSSWQLGLRCNSYHKIMTPRYCCLCAHAHAHAHAHARICSHSHPPRACRVEHLNSGMDATSPHNSSAYLGRRPRTQLRRCSTHSMHTRSVLSQAFSSIGALKPGFLLNGGLRVGLGWGWVGLIAVPN